MIDPNDPPEVQVAKQTRIIEALMQRAGRQKELGGSAYQAFQSAIELQQKVAAQSLELESVRHETERTRRNLTQALSAMEEGLALFFDGRLDVCNDLFRNLLPDIADRLTPEILEDPPRSSEVLGASTRFAGRMARVRSSPSSSLGSVSRLGSRWVSSWPVRSKGMLRSERLPPSASAWRAAVDSLRVSASSARAPRLGQRRGSHDAASLSLSLPLCALWPLVQSASRHPESTVCAGQAPGGRAGELQDSREGANPNPDRSPDP